MEKILIRRGICPDAAEIANVHINSWRETYPKIMSEEFLRDLPLSFKNRYELWQKVSIDSSQITFVAECKENGVVGFINGTCGRDAEFKDCVEIWCFYLLQQYHGQKIGFNLLKSFFDAHIELGYTKGYLWVLEKNPSISFYEKVGGKLNGKTKEDIIGKEKKRELCYVWDSIELG